MIIFMEKITVEMSPKEHKRFLAYKEAEKAVKSIRNGIEEIKNARKNNRTLKSAHALANEL